MLKRHPNHLLAGIAFCALLSIPHTAAPQPVHGLALSGGALSEMGNIQLLPQRKGHGSRIVLGDANGVVHVYESRGNGYEETWLSRYMEGSITGISVVDVNADSLTEIVVFTDQGRIHYLDTAAYNTIWSNTPGEYKQLSAPLVANVDDDPQPELIFCADGRLVIFDGRDQYEEWHSDQTNLVTTAILIADVDGDGMDEIVLNDGYVFDARSRTLEWQYASGFGDRMGVLDVDNDGILELFGEFRGRFIRIFDVDLRREKSLRANYGAARGCPLQQACRVHVPT